MSQDGVGSETVYAALREAVASREEQQPVSVRKYLCVDAASVVYCVSCIVSRVYVLCVIKCNMPREGVIHCSLQ